MIPALAVAWLKFQGPVLDGTPLSLHAHLFTTPHTREAIESMFLGERAWLTRGTAAHV